MGMRMQLCLMGKQSFLNKIRDRCTELKERFVFHRPGHLMLLVEDPKLDEIFFSTLLSRHIDRLHKITMTYYTRIP